MKLPSNPHEWSTIGKKYNIIYADPAWKYRDKRKNPDSDRPSKYGGISYDVMENKDIYNLPVNKIDEVSNINEIIDLLYILIIYLFSSPS